MFEGFMKSKFYTKSKSSIKMTKSRIEIIKRKRNATQKFLKKDIAELLKSGLDVNAYGRVEGLWNEMNMSSCYEFVEQFCNHVSNHLTEMNKQRECPDDCREAVCSLMYAAARFADLPELRDLRNVFLERYGSAVECYANKEFVYKLKLTPPAKDTKLRLMLDIAAESGVEWNAKSLEQKLFIHPIYGQEYNKNGDADVKNVPEKTDVVQNMGEEIAGYKREDAEKIASSPTGQVNESATKRRLSTRRKPLDDVDNKRDSDHKEVVKPDTKTQLNEPQNMKSSSRKDDSVDEARSKPKSVRRNKKPQAKTYSSKPENTEKPNRLQKPEDSEEEIMDRLLLHYSRKKPCDSNEKNRDNRFGSQTRTSSLPVEPNQADDYTLTGHNARTNSLQPEMLNSNGGHVHPKLPDYDDFVARLAAVRSNQE